MKKNIKPLQATEESMGEMKDNSQMNLAFIQVVHKVDDLRVFMREVWRVTKTDGVVQIIAPYHSSTMAWQDPETKRAINEMTFMHFGKEWRKKNNIKWSKEDEVLNFSVEKIDHAISPEYNGKSQDAVQYALAHFMNVATNLNIVLRKK